MVRRFRCAQVDCRRRIFAESLSEGVAARSVRRIFLLEAIVRHRGIALGGRPAATLARRLMFLVSKDTLLRVVRRHDPGDSSPLSAIGIDDWALERGQRCGSIICDLPDREPSTVEAWLSRHPEIRVISAAGITQAANRAAPKAVQVADRRHLMENASAAFLGAVRRSMRPIRAVLGSAVTSPGVVSRGRTYAVSRICNLLAV